MALRAPEGVAWRYFDVPAEGYGTFMTTAEISDKLVIKGSIKKPMPSAYCLKRFFSCIL